MTEEEKENKPDKMTDEEVLRGFLWYCSGYMGTKVEERKVFFGALQTFVKLHIDDMTDEQFSTFLEVTLDVADGIGEKDDKDK